MRKRGGAGFLLGKEERMKNMDNDTLRQLEEKTVLDEDGESLLLSSLWQEKRSVLVFVRHFG